MKEGKIKKDLNVGHVAQRRDVLFFHSLNL
jgi:hypothetical protein